MSRGAVEERATLWREPDLEDLEIFHVAYRRHSFDRHNHGAFATSIVDRGAGSIWYRGETHVAPAGCLVLLDPGETHTGAVIGEEGWSYRNLYPNPALLERLVGEAAGWDEGGRFLPHFPKPVVRDAELAAAMDRLHRSLESPKSTLERQSRLLYTYTRLLARHAKPSPRWRPAGREPRAVALAREYLETCYAHNVSLDELSSIANLSKYHLLRVFQQTVGLPPHAYLNQIRVGRVKKLLSDGVPIAVAAQETGFVDQSHLTKRFKGVLGITPGQYVRR